MNGQTNIWKSVLQLGVAGVIGLVAIYVLWNINVNDIAHLEAAVEQQTQVYVQTQKDITKVLQEVSFAITLNTEVLRTLTR